MTAEPGWIDRDRLGPTDERRAREHRNQRKQDGADRIDMNSGIQRYTTKQTCRGVAQAIGGNGVRRFVHRQRKDEDEKGDEDRDEIDVAEQAASVLQRGSQRFRCVAYCPRAATGVLCRGSLGGGPS